MSWRLLDDKELDIFSNLARDEAMAKTVGSKENTLNTIRFWQSHPAVVIGRFQCVHKEVNLAYCRANNIAIARRFTGGGAVYHDLGNLNYSLRLHQSHDYVPRGLKELYEVFVGKVIEGMNSINIPVQYDHVGSCIRIKGKKISGTAGWIKQGISFIHGTILIDADLEMLQKSLTPPEHQETYLRDRTRIRCMDSKRDTVTNIWLEVDECPSIEEIKKSIIDTLEKFTNTSILRGSITKEEQATAEALYQSQYRLSAWNFGTPTQT